MELGNKDLEFLSYLYSVKEDEDSFDMSVALSEAVDPVELANSFDLRIIDSNYPGFKQGETVPHVFVGPFDWSKTTGGDAKFLDNLQDIMRDNDGEYNNYHQILNMPGFRFPSREKAVSFVTELRNLSNDTQQSSPNVSNVEVERSLDPDLVSFDAKDPSNLSIKLIKYDGILHAMWAWGDESASGNWLMLAESYAGLSNINPWEVVEFLSKYDPIISKSGSISNVQFNGEDPNSSVPSMDTTLNYVSVTSLDGLLSGSSKSHWSHTFGVN